MTARIDNKLPYGNLPRLLLDWVCAEAVLARSREFILGDSVRRTVASGLAEPLSCF